MYNLLIDGAPDNYKGFKINTDFRVALRIQELLEDPILLSGSTVDRMAAYRVAISLLYTDAAKILDEELSFDVAIEGLRYWLSCGNDDPVTSYWKREGIMPDVEDITFDLEDYNKPASDLIDVETHDANGNAKIVKKTKYSIVSFLAPDNTVRYRRIANGDPDLVSLYEDSELIFSGFYKCFGIDLTTAQLHWFKFCWLLAELECAEDTALYKKINIRSFDPSDYKDKQYADYRAKMERNKQRNKVLGILPYIDRGN